MTKRKKNENKRAKVKKKKKNFCPFVALVGLIRVHVPQCPSSNNLK